MKTLVSIIGVIIGIYIVVSDNFGCGGIFFGGTFIMLGIGGLGSIKKVK